MKRFGGGDDRKQIALLPKCVDDYIGHDNPVRIIDAFVDELGLAELGFNGATPAWCGCRWLTSQVRREKAWKR